MSKPDTSAPQVDPVSHPAAAQSVSAQPASPGRRLPGRGVLGIGLLILLAVVAYRETRPPVFGSALNLYKVPTDFLVYYRAGEVMAHGGNLYDGPLFGDLPFTYAPFAGALFRGLAIAPEAMSATFWQLACVGGVIAVILGVLVQRGYRLDAPTAVIGVGAAVGTLALSPVRDSFFYGQINVLLMLLVAFDFLRKRDRFTGIGVGLAAGLKLTPGFFIIVFAMQRRWREAITAAATFVVTVVIGLIAVPDATTFWTKSMFESDRVGDVTISASQSLKGFCERTMGTGTASSVVWVVLVLVALVACFFAVRWATRRDNQALVMCFGGITACLVSPFSWHHHWVWLVPLVVCLVDLGARAGARLRGSTSGVRGWLTEQAAMIVTLVIVFVAMIPYCSHQISVRFSFLGQPGLPAPFDHLWILWASVIMLVFAALGLQEMLAARRQDVQDAQDAASESAETAGD
jgi:hypothetical protein